MIAWLPAFCFFFCYSKAFLFFSFLSSSSFLAYSYSFLLTYSYFCCFYCFFLRIISFSCCTAFIFYFISDSDNLGFFSSLFSSFWTLGLAATGFFTLIYFSMIVLFLFPPMVFALSFSCPLIYLDNCLLDLSFNLLYILRLSILELCMNSDLASDRSSSFLNLETVFSWADTSSGISSTTFYS